MVKRSCSRVEWYSKNWLILKIQQRSSLPSKQGTSNFRQWACTEEAKEGRTMEEAEGEEVIEFLVTRLWISSSSFKVMVWMDSLKDKWFAVSFTRPSSNRSEDAFNLVDSAMVQRQREYQNVRLPTIYTGLQGSVPPEKNERRELEDEEIFHCHFLLTRGWYL